MAPKYIVLNCLCTSVDWSTASKSLEPIATIPCNIIHASLSANVYLSDEDTFLNSTQTFLHNTDISVTTEADVFSCK